jgi:hypothetical protein
MSNKRASGSTKQTVEKIARDTETLGRIVRSHYGFARRDVVTRAQAERKGGE